MKQNKFGELIYNESDLCNLIMKGPVALDNFIVDHNVNLDTWPDIIDPVPSMTAETVRDCTVAEFHAEQQSNWHMPDQYKNLNIAEHVLSLCQSDAELQRAGEELLLFQEHDLFDLLRYLVYLVDVMKDNQIIWGVGRGSSVASYVLYKLGVHRIDSLYYNLDPREFLR
jgi:DNA polymerase III alpha subunit